MKAFDIVMEFEVKLMSFLLRFCTLLPNFLLNYLVPLTKISLANYSFGFLGIIPWQIGEYTLGYLLEDIEHLYDDKRRGYF